MKKLIFTLPLLVMIILGLVFIKGLGRDQSSETALEGQKMPPLPTLELEGYPATNVDQIIAENSLVLVNYWASWCGPCRAEHPNLAKLHEETGVPIIGINYKDDPENAQAFLKETGNPYQAIKVDDKGGFAIDWGVAGVPETFFIKDGIIAYRFVGPIVGDQYKVVLAKINELMK